MITGHAPRAVVQISRSSQSAPTFVGVNGMGSYDYDGTIQSYLWNFGDFATCPDGCTAPYPFAFHGYMAPGVYFLTLQVTDNDGNSEIRPNLIVVNPALLIEKNKTTTPPDNADRAYQRGILTSACAAKSGEACYHLANMYTQDGATYIAQQLNVRACSLGYTAACGGRAK